MLKSLYSPKGFTVLSGLERKDLHIIEKHSDITEISIWLEGLATPDLDFLLQCDKLESVAIYGGKVGDYSALGNCRDSGSSQ